MKMLLRTLLVVVGLFGMHTNGQSLPTCGTPGCKVTLPAGVFTFSTQVAPSFPMTIEGAGAFYDNAGSHCATTLQWTGGASAPFLFTGTAATGFLLEGFCLYATSGAAPPVLVDVDAGATGDLRNVVVDYNSPAGKVLPTVAAFRWGATAPVNDVSCHDTFVRGVAIGYDVLSVENIFNGDHCRAISNLNNELVLGGANVVETFFCSRCSWAGAFPIGGGAGHTSILVNNVKGLVLTDNEFEFGNGNAAYALECPSTATTCIGMEIHGGQFFPQGGAATAVQAAIHTSLANATLTLTAPWVFPGGNTTNPFYLVKNDSAQRVTILGADNQPTGALDVSLGTGVTDLGSYLNGSPGGVTTNFRLVSNVAIGTPPLSVVSTTPVPNLTTVPTTYNHTGTQQTNVKIVEDTVALAGGVATVTLSGAATFAGATTYSCTAIDNTGANPVKVVQTSGTSIGFTGTGTDTVRFVCVGN